MGLVQAAGMGSFPPTEGSFSFQGSEMFQAQFSLGSTGTHTPVGVSLEAYIHPRHPAMARCRILLFGIIHPCLLLLLR